MVGSGLGVKLTDVLVAIVRGVQFRVENNYNTTNEVIGDKRVGLIELLK